MASPLKSRDERERAEAARVVTVNSQGSAADYADFNQSVKSAQSSAEIPFQWEQLLTQEFTGTDTG